MRRIRLDLRELLTLVGMIVLVVLILGGSYVLASAMLKLDNPVTRILKIEPTILPEASYDAFLIADTWNLTKGYVEQPYVPRFTGEETEDEFFARMADVDRRSLYNLVRDFPELIEGGWSYIEFDALAEFPSPLYDEERNAKLKEAILSGIVFTNQGHTILAMDGLRSIMLIQTNINDTDGFMAVTYDRKKLFQEITNTAHEGWWSTMREFIEDNHGAVAAIPANDHTYNARLGFGIVSGGFDENRIPRYKPSGALSLYMGFKSDGVFYVGEGTRFGMDNFAEGQGLLLIHGAPPERVVVPDYEQIRILEHLAEYIDNYVAASLEEDSVIPPIDVNADDFNSLPLILAFIESFEDYELQARYAWVIRENVITNALADISFNEERLLMLKDYYEQFEVVIEREERDISTPNPDNEDVQDVRTVTISYEIKMPDLTEANVPVENIVMGAEQEIVLLIMMCNKMGADTYAEEVVPVRSAATAIGQRHSDGATYIFGIGGEKMFDVRELPGIGATYDEIQELFLLYGATNAAITTSGNRVGFGWKEQNLLRVKDTTTEGGRAYGAYIIK